MEGSTVERGGEERVRGREGRGVEAAAVMASEYGGAWV
jgi:hypothetical protein